MVDMDEFLYIVNDTLKAFLANKKFDKCNFIIFNWVIPTDNGLIYYDERPLFKRFKPPYKKSFQVKSIIRGNISNLTYGIHTPQNSPIKNITCNNEGKKIYYKQLPFNVLTPININKGYIIHFRYKTLEEFLNKLRRGWRSSKDKNRNGIYTFLSLFNFFQINSVTKEKINFLYNEIDINLYKNK